MITDTRADGTGNAMAGVVPDGPISGVLAQNWWVTCSISCADAWIWEANPLAASTNDHGAVPDIKPPEFVSLFGWGPFLRPGLHNRKRRAQWRSRLAAGHRQRRRAAVLTAASTAQCSIGPGLLTRPAGVMVLSAVLDSRNLASGRLVPLCPERGQLV